MAWRDNGLRDLFNRIRTCHEEWSNDGQKIHCDNYQFGHCDAFQFGGLDWGPDRQARAIADYLLDDRRSAIRA
jgi:hypothetical protein